MTTDNTPIGSGSTAEELPEKERLYELFHAALDVPSNARSRFLEQACNGNTSLRSELDLLLVHDCQADREGFLGQLLGRADGPAHPATQTEGVQLIGRRLGPYEVQNLIARGGMGAVYRAVRTDDYTQVVAVKVVRAELLSETALLRFVAERQILAGLAHPNIPRLLDGGTTAEGLPYAIQEFVDGDRINRYADSENLDSIGRLRLLASACKAVEYAHRNGVIHRDLKPSNVLVDRHGQVKVVDFGLARHLGANAESFTATGEVVGTVAYMSPEQLAAAPGAGDTRSDVYALGVIGYELLTGRSPVPISGLGLVAAARAVSESDVVPLAAVNRAFRGDLDAVFRMALAKDPEARYPSAGAFAADLERNLRGEPVEARPPSLFASVRRFARRHRVAVASGTSILTVLILALLAVSASLLHARQKEVEADAARGRAEEGRRQARAAVADALTAVAHSNPLRTSGLEATRRDLLIAALRYYDRFEAEGNDDPALPQTVAYATAVVAQSAMHLKDYEAAVEWGQKAVARYEALAATTDDPGIHNQLALVVERQGFIHEDRHEMDARDACYARALAVREALVAGPGGAEFRGSLAQSYANLGEVAAGYGNHLRASELLLKSRDIWAAMLREKPQNIYFINSQGTVLRDLGELAMQGGDTAGAAKYYKESITVLASVPGVLTADETRRQSLAYTHRIYADLLVRQGRSEEAVTELRSACRVLDEFARDYPLTAAESRREIAKCQGRLSQVLLGIERVDEAAEAAERHAAASPDDPEELLNAARSLASCVPASKVSPGTRADRAVEILGLALRKGLKDPQRIRTDPAFDRIRDRPNFPSLVPPGSRADNK